MHHGVIRAIPNIPLKSSTSGLTSTSGMATADVIPCRSANFYASTLRYGTHPIVRNSTPGWNSTSGSAASDVISRATVTNPG